MVRTIVPILPPALNTFQELPDARAARHAKFQQVTALERKAGAFPLGARLGEYGQSLRLVQQDKIVGCVGVETMQQLPWVQG